MRFSRWSALALPLLYSSLASAQQYVISTYAGGAPQATPVPGTAASIGNPGGVATDGAGSVYFVGDDCVFRLDTNGVLTRVAGNSRVGYSGDGGPATSAQLSVVGGLPIGPSGVAVDSAGNLYIADTDNYRIRKVTPAGIISTVAGNGSLGYSGDGGQAVGAQLSYPASVAVDGAGNLYIADTANNAVRKVTPAGVISTVAGNGRQGYSGDGGPATSAQPSDPCGLAVDSAGNLYIADNQNWRIREITPAGIISTVAGNGSYGYSGDGGPAIDAEINFPLGTAVDSAGNLYIADQGNSVIRRVTPAGIISTVAGGGYSGDGGPATSAQLNGPSGVAVDGAGNLYIADSGNKVIRKVNPAEIIGTVAGNGIFQFSGDGGPAASAQLYFPWGVATDGAGNLYIADAFNNRVRKVTAAGIISTVAGNGSQSYSGDGGPAASAALDLPYGVAVDSAGNLYIADTDNNRVRKVTPAGTISTVAGIGICFCSNLGDGGPATSAALGSPYGVAVDSAGNLYIADTVNERIRKVNLAGIISTVAGNGSQGYSGDGGPATSAELAPPTAVAVDSAGNLYIADLGNGRIREVTPAGIISTVAGNGSYGYSGDGGPAVGGQLNRPSGVAVDSAGNLYIADNGNGRIRKITPAGIISTIAGNGTAGYSGDGGPALSAQLWGPTGLAVDSAGNVSVADGGYAGIAAALIAHNNAVRLLQPQAPAPAPPVLTPGGLGPDFSSVNMFSRANGSRSTEPISPVRPLRGAEPSPPSSAARV